MQIDPKLVGRRNHAEVCRPWQNPTLLTGTPPLTALRSALAGMTRLPDYTGPHFFDASYSCRLTASTRTLSNQYTAAG